MPDRRPRRPADVGGAGAGLTLIELLVVLLVVAALAGMALPLLGGSRERAAAQATEASLVRLQAAILGEEGQPGYLADMGALPGSLTDLLLKPDGADAFDPATGRGWRGPYVRHRTGHIPEGEPYASVDAYGAPGDPAMLDGWGRPIVLQRPNPGDPTDPDARLVSAGPSGILSTPPDAAHPPEEDRGDDLVLFLMRADAPLP